MYLSLGSVNLLNDIYRSEPVSIEIKKMNSEIKVAEFSEIKVAKSE